MSTRASTAAGRRRPAARRRVTRAQALRRRVGWLLGVAAATALAFTLVHPMMNKAVEELSLPLHHEDIIRQQAADKGLDPSMIAAVIYVESHFRDQTSVAGAKGL